MNYLEGRTYVNVPDGKVSFQEVNWCPAKEKAMLSIDTQMRWLVVGIVAS